MKSGKSIQSIMAIDKKKLAAGIYSGAIDLNNLPLDVYKHNAKELVKGLRSGYASGLNKSLDTIAFNSEDQQMLQYLSDNVFKFSAAKTFQQVDEMTSGMVSGRKVVPFKDFKNLVASISDRYNVDYLRTEYETAISSGISSASWLRYEAEKETLPNLRYVTIGDACEICGPLNGVVFPVTDKFWNYNNVPEHFNCKCLLQQEDSSVKVTGAKEKADLEANLKKLKSPIFNNNVGKTKEVFNDRHPYFSMPKSYFDKLQKDNLGLPTEL